MATRYISAIEYADYHAKRVLKKHAKKRPLGEIESKHRYTPAQPVLSCRTVDIDVSGTRTYRSRSTTDIIQEQHKLIHNIFTKPRNITSAPQGRNFSPRQPEDNFSRRQRINIEVHGRPLTSQSQSSLQQPHRTKLSIRRPKTTGTLKKNLPKGYTLLREESDLQETNKNHRELTNKIRKQWQPENHDLNVGKFVRGQNKPEAPPSLDNWLTFGGVHSDEASGVIDAFAEVKDDEQYYSIEGRVGSRVAQQLQKGDKIRVGINGRVQSQDLKIKRPETRQDNPVIEEKSEKENMEKTVVPLCWDDTVNISKVISPRDKQDSTPRPVMSETHPVYFPREEEDNKNYKGKMKTAAQVKEGFKIKHRTKSRPCMDGQEHDKIIVITIDHKTDKEENHLQGLSVDDVLKHGFSGKVSSIADSSRDNFDAISQSTAPTASEPLFEHRETPRCQSKNSMAESQFSVETARSSKMKPVSPATYSPKPMSADLIVGPSSGHVGRRSNDSPIKSGSSTRIGSEKSTISKTGSEKGSAKHHPNKPTPSKPIHIAYSSQSSFNMYGTKGETEFIQITSQIRNPNPPVMQHNSVNKETYISPSTNDEVIQEVVRQNEPVLVKGESLHHLAPAPSPQPIQVELESNTDGMISAPPTARSVSPGNAALSINIPTAEDFFEHDSQANSPWPSHRGAVPVEEPVPAHLKREHAMRDNQIDQITSLLKGAIVDPSDPSIQKEKTVKFQEGS